MLIVFFFVPCKSRSGYLSLEIPITSLDDTGEYEVEVRNEQGRIRSTCYMQVERKYGTGEYEVEVRNEQGRIRSTCYMQVERKYDTVGRKVEVGTNKAGSGQHATCK